MDTVAIAPGSMEAPSGSSVAAYRPVFQHYVESQRLDSGHRFEGSVRRPKQGLEGVGAKLAAAGRVRLVKSDTPP